MTLSRCKRCGVDPVHDAVTRSVRCPKCAFGVSVPEGGDEFAVWNGCQASMKDRVKMGPRNLTRKERQEQFDMRMEADLRRRAINDMMAEDAAVYD